MGEVQGLLRVVFLGASNLKQPASISGVLILGRPLIAAFHLLRLVGVGVVGVGGGLDLHDEAGGLQAALDELGHGVEHLVFEDVLEELLGQLSEVLVLLEDYADHEFLPQGHSR